MVQGAHRTTEVEAFLAEVLPSFTEAEIAFHDGNAAPRFEQWSRNDPVIVFGAARTARGWEEVGPVFEWLAERFSKCESYEFELLAAGASGDLAYIAGIEHTNASILGAPPQAYRLRSTTVFRREDGQWKAVHRHADPVPGDEGAPAQLRRIKAGSENL